MSLTWVTILDSEFSKYTMIYRKGYYAREKWAAPDTHPLVIKTVHKTAKFNLSHMVYIVKRTTAYHAIVAYVCG